MSLISCIMMDMQSSMLASDLEDRSADIAQELKAATEDVTEFGKYLSDRTTLKDDLNSRIRVNENKRSYGDQYGYDQNTIDSDLMADYQELQELLAEIREADYTKKDMQRKEKELTAEQKKIDVQLKLAEQTQQKFAKMEDNAMKRFFGTA